MATKRKGYRKLSDSELKFLDLMVNAVPIFDEEMLATIRPTDSWVFNVSYTTAEDDVLAKVRFISENAVNSIPQIEEFKMGSPVDITQDRFKDVWR